MNKNFYLVFQKSLCAQGLFIYLFVISECVSCICILKVLFINDVYF